MIESANITSVHNNNCLVFKNNNRLKFPYKIKTVDAAINESLLRDFTGIVDIFHLLCKVPCLLLFGKTNNNKKRTKIVVHLSSDRWVLYICAVQLNILYYTGNIIIGCIGQTSFCVCGGNVAQVDYFCDFRSIVWATYDGSVSYQLKR